MSTATALRPAAGPNIAWLPITLVFVVGAAIGAVASAAVIPAVSDSPPSVTAAAAANTELTRLLGNMDTAAERGDTRLFVEFRQELSQLIGSTDISGYRALRGIDTPGE
jgi:hypothetical protein